MTDRRIEILSSNNAVTVADDLQDAARYYRDALTDAKRAAEKATEYATESGFIDSKWLTQAAKKAAECEAEIQTLVRIAKYVGLTRDQIALAVGVERIWFMTPADADEMGYDPRS